MFVCHQFFEMYVRCFAVFSSFFLLNRCFQFLVFWLLFCFSPISFCLLFFVGVVFPLSKAPRSKSKVSAASEDRTRDLGIMGPTRCQLCYRRLNVNEARQNTSKRVYIYIYIYIYNAFERRRWTFTTNCLIVSCIHRSHFGSRYTLG